MSISINQIILVHLRNKFDPIQHIMIIYYVWSCLPFYPLSTALPNLVPTGITLPAKAFLNARLDFGVSKSTKNQKFFTQNGLFSNNKVLLFLKIARQHFLSLICARSRKRLGTADLAFTVENGHFLLLFISLLLVQKQKQTVKV